MSAMFTDPMLDPTGSIITEARADVDVANLVDARVRAVEPGPGDAKGPGEYQAFVTIAALSLEPHLSLPVTFAEYAVNAYGVTPRNATEVWAALVKAFHKVGTRMKASGLGIYQSLVLTGGTQDFDPQTQQPVIRGTLRVIATTLVVETAGS